MTTTIPDQAPRREDAPRLLDDPRILRAAETQWIREEFDRIIAAEWPSPPPDRPGCQVAVKRPHPQHARLQTVGNHRQKPTRPAYPGIGRWGSPRSPPRQPLPATKPKYANRVKGRW